MTDNTNIFHVRNDGNQITFKILFVSSSCSRIFHMSFNSFFVIEICVKVNLNSFCRLFWVFRFLFFLLSTSTPFLIGFWYPFEFQNLRECYANCREFSLQFLHNFLLGFSGIWGFWPAHLVDLRKWLYIHRLFCIYIMMVYQIDYIFLTWSGCAVLTIRYYIIIFTNRAGYDTRSIFKRSLTGLNSQFSFF